MKVYFISPYPGNYAPSQRFRFEDYFSWMEKSNIDYELLPFFTEHGWKIINDKKGWAFTSYFLIGGFFRRIFHLTCVHDADFIFIHREATPLGPPIFEWFMARVLRKRIIYDFDDAIWLTDRQHESGLFRLLKWRSKVKLICTWSYKISCGNRYLQAYALRFNPLAFINPTTLECSTRHIPPLKSHSENLVIGWTGSQSTLKYLERIESVLQKMEAEFNHVSFLVIADQPPNLKLQRLVFMRWSPESEIEDLSKMDIGIMPLPDDEWTKGKCGFKALQYMALEIPAVVSPVGVNTEIVQHGLEGFLCATETEWISSLRLLINNADLRRSMGKNGRKKVMAHYSVASNSSNFLSLFE